MRPLHSRVRRLESTIYGDGRVVVISFRNEEDRAAQLAAVEQAIGPISDADLVVCVRRFGDVPPRSPTVDGRDVPWAA